MRSWQNFSHKRKHLPFSYILIGSVALLLVTIVFSLHFGVVRISFSDISTNAGILRYVRFPRVLSAVFAGAGLAGAGVIIQTLFGNTLAGPNIIGVNSGAGFMTVIASLVFPLLPQLQPVAAFLGAIISVLFVYMLSKRSGTSKTTLLLSGIILNCLFNAASEALCTFFPEINMGYTSFRMGGLSAIRTSVLYPAIVLILISVFIAIKKADILELLSLGDETAFSLGISVKKHRLIFLLCAACMAGASVSFAGLIGFLGLIVPHSVRLIVGEEIRKLLPLSVIWGSILLLVCDTVARTLFAPFELSVGILISIIGAPIFIKMLMKKKTR